MNGEIARVTLAVGLSYLIGAIPWSWLAGRYIGGLDLRRVGSGNLGASNTFRALGARVALPVLALDVAKGVVAPAVLAPLAAGGQAAHASLWATLCGVAAILGHMFPIYLGFRGGKGIATAAGVFGALEPLAFGVSGIVFLLAFAATRGIVSVGSLLGTATLPAAIYVLGKRADTLEPTRLWIVIALVLVVWMKHGSNITRLLRGNEKSVFQRRSLPAQDRGATG